MTPKLKELLEEATRHTMTSAEVWDQRVSFVYGQMNGDVTKDMVIEQVTKSHGPRPIDDVEELGPHTNMTVREVLEYSLRNSSDYTEILILGYTIRETFITHSSKISRKDALWLIEVGKQTLFE